jgi:hypothetical protein
MKRIVYFAILCTAAASLAHAQGLGQFVGIVTDPSGSAVPSAVPCRVLQPVQPRESQRPDQFRRRRRFRLDPRIERSAHRSACFEVVFLIAAERVATLFPNLTDNDLQHINRVRDVEHQRVLAGFVRREFLDRTQPRPSGT